MPKRTGLGKGLDALIPAGQMPSGESGISHISIDLIQRNPRQPREKFDLNELENLAASIREHGVIQPLVVSPGKNGVYILVAGERRLQASRKAGLKTAFVARPTEHGEDQSIDLAPEEDWDVVAKDFVDLAAKLEA